MQSSENVLQSLQQKHAALIKHPVFSALSRIEDLHLFMEWHVFAVWDFMSLVKRLQKELTCIQLPWTPPANPQAARLINEIVLGEESDEAPQGTMSHYDLYLQAMREVGANTDRIENFVSLIRAGTPVASALQTVQAPAAVQEFVRATMEVALKAPLHAVMGNFFYGRENVIPDMFKRLLAEWSIKPAQVPTLVFYLDRHIELDGDDHGPAAQKIIAEICGGDEAALQQILRAGCAALEQRYQLWDGLLAQIESNALSLQD